MHYHTLKMREINDLLRDYWRSIYRGQDIEEIFISQRIHILLLVLLGDSRTVALPSTHTDRLLSACAESQVET
jgi:hypothetical protein